MKKLLYIFIPIIIIGLIFAFFISAKYYNSAKTGLEEIYSYRNTKLENIEAVGQIVDITNLSSYKAEDISVDESAFPKRLTISFKVDDRSNYRNIDYLNLNKNVALIFSLIDDLEEITYLFFDNYSETAFTGVYYSRNFLYERKGMEIFKPEYINNATKNIDLFEDYYDEVLKIKFENSLSELLSEIFKFLGNDYEIVTNSAISCDIKLDSLFNTDDYEILKNIIGPQLSHYTATPHTMKLTLYDVKNFKTDEIKKYLIAFYDDKELGIVVIGQKILENEQEILEIKNQIIKRN